MSNTGASTSYELRDNSIYANNATGSVKWFGTSAINTDSTVGVSTASVDMTADQTLTIKAWWPSVPGAGETVTLDAWTIELIESD